MALPTMDLPTYELEIPSNKKKIKNAVYELLKSCITTRIKLENLATFDLEYIFLNIRAVSVGEIVELNVICTDDNETQVRHNVNLTDVKVSFPEGHSNKIMLDEKTGVIMKYPSFLSLIHI